MSLTPSVLSLLSTASGAQMMLAREARYQFGFWHTVVSQPHSTTIVSSKHSSLFSLGAAITIGLWTYGYNMMRQLGNRLTLHSPSRGFSMELGAALTVVIATRLALPISTTQCITGATVGVGKSFVSHLIPGWKRTNNSIGLCSGTLRAINWRMILWIYAGWVFTLPIAGLVSYSLMAIIINAPRWELIPIPAN